MTVPDLADGAASDVAPGADAEQEEVAPAPARRSPLRSGLQGAVLELVVLLLMALAIALVMRATVGQAFRIPSGSMVPQLEVGDRVVVSRLAYRLHDPRRGDVVVFHCPPRAGCAPGDEGGALPLRLGRDVLEAMGMRTPSPEEFIKRVVALPGEEVEGRDGGVYVDGRRLVEPYLADQVLTSDFAPVLVGEGQVFVLGDNRTNSSDGRVFGPVEADTIVGRAIARVWPPQRAAFL